PEQPQARQDREEETGPEDELDLTDRGGPSPAEPGEPSVNRHRGEGEERRLGAVEVPDVLGQIADAPVRLQRLNELEAAEPDHGPSLMQADQLIEGKHPQQGRKQEQVADRAQREADGAANSGYGPRSPVRMRMASSTWMTKIFQSPILPERAAFSVASSTR